MYIRSARPLNVCVLAAWTALIAVACDDPKPLDLEGSSGTDDAGAGGSGGESAGGSASGGSSGGSSAAGGGAEPAEHRDAQGRLLVVQIDRQGLRDTVLPILDARCAGPLCHTGTPATDARFFFKGPAAELTDAELDAAAAEVADFSDFYAPERSELLRFAASRDGGDPNHPIPAVALSAESADYAAIVAWMQASVVAVEDEPPPVGGAGGAGGEGGATPPGGPTTIPCGGLPSTSASRYDFATFQSQIDPMLNESCAEAGCHGTQGTAGSFWLVRTESECDAKWNFYAVQWFVDPIDPAASPVLLQPIDPRHGGAEVFHGQNDERYVALRRWIEAAWAGR